MGHILNLARSRAAPSAPASNAEASQQHEAAIAAVTIAEAVTDALPDAGTEARRQRVLALLALHPDWRYAVITDDHSDPETTTVHIGIRGVGTGEVVMAKARYDGAELIRLLNQYARGTDEGLL